MKLSILIPAKNEQDVIGECLESVRWADEVIVMVNNSTDNTAQIVKSFPWVKSITTSGGTFATRKNDLLKLAKGKWVFYIDADERITPLLKREIKETLESKNPVAAYAIPRRQFLLGKELKWGGWGGEDSFVMRLFQKSKLKTFHGDLHETPIFEGEFRKLTEPLIHLQPSTLEEAFQKSINWTDVEAKLFLAPGINHPPVVWWRALRMGATTLFERLIKKQGFRDGIEGWIESVYQAYHTMIIYLRLWESQSA
jgi:glycosyltransferase involved in cell wall biosynthesis